MVLQIQSLKKPEGTRGAVWCPGLDWTWNRKETSVENWRNPNQVWSAVNRNVLVLTSLRWLCEVSTLGEAGEVYAETPYTL